MHTKRTSVLPDKYSVSAIEPKHETTPAQGYNAGADGVGSREYLLARMIGSVSESPALSADNSTNTTQNTPDASERAEPLCVCLERIGDNGYCPVHGGSDV